ncbi:hypothetical protein MMC11_003758 [Xylographa trunciseda]|nr:hypothetical protein [Xylographa trunciseda]
MAAHIDAFRTGDPFAMTKIVLQSYTRSDYAAAYYGGLLVWSVDMSYTTNLRCLRTGRTKLWVNQGRSKTHCIAVSELLVATCDHFGNVSVHNHLTDDEYIFKLSSANVKGFALRSTTLAILLDHNVLVWSLETQKTRQIPVLLEGGIGEMWDRFQLQFTANGEDIIYSHTFVDDSSAGKVTFSRVPLDGAPQETSTVHEITSSGESICRKTCQRTPSKLHTFGIMNYNDEAILISYDEFRNQPQFHVLGRSHSLWPQTGYLEKHVLYKSAIVKQGGSRKLLVKDLHSHRDQHNATWKPTHMDGAKFTSRIDGQYEVLGDETFLVHMFDTHIAAYCFDQHSQGGHSWTKLRPLPVTNKK